MVKLQSVTMLQSQLTDGSVRIVFIKVRHNISEETIKVKYIFNHKGILSISYQLLDHIINSFVAHCLMEYK